MKLSFGLNGAGYTADSEVFLQGQPLNVTDIEVGPDGALDSQRRLVLAYQKTRGLARYDGPGRFATVTASYSFPYPVDFRR